MPTRQRILEQWNGFSRALKLDEAPSVQRIEMQKAFFAGAIALFSVVMNMLDPGTEPTEKDLQVMTEISEELKNYPKQTQAHGAWTVRLGVSNDTST